MDEDKIKQEIEEDVISMETDEERNKRKLEEEKRADTLKKQRHTMELNIKQLVKDTLKLSNFFNQNHRDLYNNVMLPQGTSPDKYYTNNFQTQIQTGSKLETLRTKFKSIEKQLYKNYETTALKLAQISKTPTATGGVYLNPINLEAVMSTLEGMDEHISQNIKNTMSIYWKSSEPLRVLDYKDEEWQNLVHSKLQPLIPVSIVPLTLELAKQPFSVSNGTSTSAEVDPNLPSNTVVSTESLLNLYIQEKPFIELRKELLPKISHSAKHLYIKFFRHYLLILQRLRDIIKIRRGLKHEMSFAIIDVIKNEYSRYHPLYTDPAENKDYLARKPFKLKLFEHM